MIKVLNPVISNLAQSINNCVKLLLNEFQEVEPKFNYKLFYSNDYDYEFDRNTFNIILSVGDVNRIPCHYESVGIDESLLVAGSVDINLSIINPVAKEYKDNIPLSDLKEDQITYDYLDDENNPNTLNYSSEDEDGEFFGFTDEENAKVQEGVRILEALSMFMYRRMMKVDDFEFTFNSNIPTITGEMDSLGYRLTEAIYIDCKFQQTTTYRLASGEDVELFIKFNDGLDVFDKAYCLSSFNLNFSTVDDTYPLTPKVMVQNQLNQMSASLDIAFPAIVNIGAQKKLVDYFESANINALQNVVFRYTEDGGKTYKETTGNFSNLSYPRAIDQFGTFATSIILTSPITKVV